MSHINEGYFCMNCGVRKIAHGAVVCSNCKSAKSPCWDSNQVTISINWQELSFLCNDLRSYSRYASQEELDSWKLNKEKIMKEDTEILKSICARIEAQYPTLHALTLQGQIVRMQERFGAENVKRIMGF